VPVSFTLTPPKIKKKQKPEQVEGVHQNKSIESRSRSIIKIEGVMNIQKNHNRDHSDKS
jgi:hypothetical protein